MTTSNLGWLLTSQGRFSILCTTSSDSSSNTRPKITCLPFRWGVGAHVMKNYTVMLLSLSYLASVRVASRIRLRFTNRPFHPTIANRPAESNCTSKLSSSKWSPYMLRLPVPSPYRKETHSSTYFHKIASLDHEALYHSNSLQRSPNPHLWNFVFLYPIGILDTRYSPVQNCLHVNPPRRLGLPEVLHGLRRQKRSHISHLWTDVFEQF